MRAKKVSRVRGQVPQKARFYSEMTPRQAIFFNYLKNLGYNDDDIVYRPSDFAKNLAVGNGAVFRKYTPTFFVTPELTVYDVDTQLSEQAKITLLDKYNRDGYEFLAVSEADFPFDEYVETEVVPSHES